MRSRVVDGEGASRERRPIWLVIRGDAPAFGAEDLARAGTRVRILTDPAGIADLLRRERPRLAIVDGPAPGDDGGPGAIGARLEALAAAYQVDASEVIEDGILSIAGRFELDVFAHELREGPRVVHLRPTIGRSTFMSIRCARRSSSSRNGRSTW